jgi:hypothetical protein
MVSFIRNHNKSLTLFRKYSKNKELIQHAETRFATKVLASTRVVEVRSFEDMQRALNSHLT